MNNEENKNIEQTEEISETQTVNIDNIENTTDSLSEETTTDAAETADNITDEKSEKKPKKAKKVKAKKKFNKRSFKHGTMSVILTIVFIAAVVVVNVIVSLISARFDTTVDLTDSGIYSLEESTQTYLEEQLNSDVTITVLTPETDFEAQGSHYKQINEILKKMQMAGSHVTLNYLDLDQNPNYSSQFKAETVAENYIVVESEKTGRHRIISPYDYFSFNETYLQYYGSYVVEGSNIEQTAVSAMMYVSNDDLVKVAFTEGFGELDSTTLQSLLTKNGYEVETINLSTIDEIDSEYDFVVMYAPTMDIDNEHLTKLDKYLDNGGAFGKNLIYFASAQQPETPNIESFLNDWGISVGYSVIGQSDSNYLISNYTAYAHLQQVCDTDYAGSAYGSSLYTFGSDLRPVIQLWEDGSRGGVEQEILMKSYDNAFLYPLDLGDKEFSYEQAESGTFNDAIVAYRLNSDTQALTRVAVFGSEQLAGSTFMSMSNANNQDFFINMFNYISGKEDTITIKSKSFSSTTFDMNTQTANTLAVVLCIVIPVVVIVLGIVIWVRRRHR
jgi:hypothetical protein